MGTRTAIVLTCRECGARNYKTTRKVLGRAGGKSELLSLKKFCPGCAKHTVHVEAK